ncbi:MAG: GGDEF domain-containing protein [Burkholderiales bacterium]|nr:GGDEF domain-containing protein [Burkholderiales bacterium]
MFAWMSATDVAFAMVAVTQAVLAGVWLFGSSLMGEIRRAAMHWAVFAGGSSFGFLLLIVALHVGGPTQAEAVRAVGNMSVMLAIVALQRGVWIFVDHPPAMRVHVLVLAISLIASLIGLAPAGGSLRVATLSTLLSLVSLGVSRDLYLYARDRLHFRWPWLMAVPGVFTVVGFTWRGLRVLVWPATVGSEIIVDSPLNVASGLGYVVIVLAFHASLFALVVGRLLADLRHRARHDDLTGLLNRRAIEEGIEAQIRRSLRSGEPFSVLMLDLDHFKSVNDRFGHGVGDRALKHVAQSLKSGVREIDALARIGGEEFVALMPGATLAAVAPVADRLREQLAAHPLMLDDKAVPVTVSIGIAQWSEAGEDMSRLLVRADAALYQAKQLGRNRVVVGAAGGAHAAAFGDAALAPQSSAHRP